MCEIIFTINFYFESFQTEKSHCRLSQKCHSNFETIKNIMRIKRINHCGDATLFNTSLLHSVSSYVANNIVFDCITIVSMDHRIRAIQFI